MYVNIVLYSPHKCFLDRNLVRGELSLAQTGFG